jgi:hypothetical protein
MGERAHPTPTPTQKAAAAVDQLFDFEVARNKGRRERPGRIFRRAHFEMGDRAPQRVWSSVSSNA